MAERVPEPGDNRSAFERFEDLTRRVVKVPKAELDKLREKQARPKRPSRRRS